MKLISALGLSLSILMTSSVAFAWIGDWFRPQRTCIARLRGQPQEGFKPVSPSNFSSFEMEDPSNASKPPTLAFRVQNQAPRFYAEKAQSSRNTQTLIVLGPESGLTVQDYRGTELSREEVGRTSTRLSVDPQEGGTCAVHSSRNCIIHMAENGALGLEHRHILKSWVRDELLDLFTTSLEMTNKTRSPASQAQGLRSQGSSSNPRVGPRTRGRSFCRSIETGPLPWTRYQDTQTHERIEIMRRLGLTTQLVSGNQTRANEYDLGSLAPRFAYGYGSWRGSHSGDRELVSNLQSLGFVFR